MSSTKIINSQLPLTIEMADAEDGKYIQNKVTANDFGLCFLFFVVQKRAASIT